MSRASAGVAGARTTRPGMLAYQFSRLCECCAATWRPAPVVIRMATGAGRQVAAQHSHSLENWYASIPGLVVLAPATPADARDMLLAALASPDPVVIFEHVQLYNVEDEVPEARNA